MSRKTKYWEMEHVKGKPFVIAIADFHENMSMEWTMNGLISILYGIVADIEKSTQKSGVVFKKGVEEIQPLFLDKANENVSAVMFSAVGTLAKFNRMGVQAGLGDGKSKLMVHKIFYKEGENETRPVNVVEAVTENSCEKWNDGMMIFHNPYARFPLSWKLFPHASHHYYKNGDLETYAMVGSKMLMSSHTVNLRYIESQNIEG